ncbi:unnamed protein product [Discosporangium mesarthrocarpum]
MPGACLMVPLLPPSWRLVPLYVLIQTMAAGKANGSRGGVGGGGAASFREVVESYAEANGVTFLPKPGRQHEGKQMYSFGGVSVFLDQSVVFAEAPPGSGNWSPLGLEDLLDYARKRRAGTSGGGRGVGGEQAAAGGAFGGID